MTDPDSEVRELLQGLGPTPTPEAELATWSEALRKAEARGERNEPLCRCQHCGTWLAVKFRDSKPDPSWWVTPCPKCVGGAEGRGLRKAAKLAMRAAPAGVRLPLRDLFNEQAAELERGR